MGEQVGVNELTGPFLTTARTYLRNLQESDASGTYSEWFNDEEVCRWNSHHRFPMSVEDVRQYAAESSSARDRVVFAVIATDTDRHIGNISLQSIDYINRSAEFAIVFGERDYWGKGLASEASRVVVAHGFSELNLNRIYCGTPEGNAGMIRLAAALGMKEEGRSRQAFFKAGQYHDVIHYGLLSNEHGG